LPKRTTVKSIVLDFWRQNGEAAYSDLRDVYLKASEELGFNAKKSSVRFNLTRILKENGKKLGPPGSSALWKFTNKERRILRESKKTKNLRLLLEKSIQEDKESSKEEARKVAKKVLMRIYEEMWANEQLMEAYEIDQLGPVHEVVNHITRIIVGFERS